MRAVTNGLVEVTTPYLDRHNDFVQIYARRDGNDLILTDAGYTIDDLEMSGCDFQSPKRQEILATAINGFGVRINKETNELYVGVNPADFSFKKHNLIQCILAVNDMFYLATPVVHSLFIENVTQWLDMKDIRYTRNVSFTGKTGYSHTFDFVIPKSKAAPERVIKAINNPNKDTAQSYAFSWIDTKETRPANARAYAFLNDTDKEINSNVTNALLSYEITPFLWSDREKRQAALVD